MATPVLLSTASVSPLSCRTAFELAARVGFDGVEVMVWTDPVSQDGDELARLAREFDVPVRAVHAPTLVLSQRVWGSDPWRKIDRSIELAEQLGAQVVVLHPALRWQRDYAEGFVAGVADRQRRSEVVLAVENMYPWRVSGRRLQGYLPSWNPLDHPFPAVTLDLSHTATAQVDALAMARELGPRLRHVHLADGSSGPLDDHLVPGEGTQPCAAVLEHLAGSGYSGMVAVEVATRRADMPQRLVALAKSLAFARLYLDPVLGSGRV